MAHSEAHNFQQVQDSDHQAGSYQGAQPEPENFYCNALYSLAPSPVNIVQLQKDLAHYDTAEAKSLLDGFKNGLSLQYDGPRKPTDSKHLKSAITHADIVMEKNQKEVDLKRVAGPFQRPIPTLRISPIGVVPKKAPNEFRLIHHLTSKAFS